MLDFDEILVGIKNPEIKKYVEESIKSYSVKNYRSAIIAIWIAAMFDLVKKFEILVEQREPTAIEKWHKLQPNIENHKNWESQLLDSAEKVAMISQYEADSLRTLSKIRNRYAHPSFEEQKEFASELIISLNNNNWSTMNLLNFENRNDVPIKWTKMLLDSWTEKVELDALLMNRVTIYTEHYLGLLNRHETEAGDYKETGNILKSIIDMSCNENFSKLLNLDENDDAWLFLQKILLRNRNIE